MKEVNMKTPLKKDYPIVEIAENVYQIDEFGAVYCYLVVGTEKAMLIDMGTGLGDLLGAIREITDLPLIVVATHAHVDHIGGKGQFETIYMHESDDNRKMLRLTGKFARRVYLKMSKTAKQAGVKRYHIKKSKIKTKIEHIDDLEEFHLGGKTIVVKHTPGHSKGSLVFVLEEEKIIFTGDYINLGLWMFTPGSTTIADWLDGTEEFLEFAKDYTCYCGHLPGLQTQEQMKNVVAVGKEILELYPKNKKFSKIKIYPKINKKELQELEDISQFKGCIFFRTGNVQKKNKRKKK